MKVYMFKDIKEFDNIKDKFDIESITIVCKVKPGYDGYPMDPIYHKDQGFHYPMVADDIEKYGFGFGREAYE